MEHKVFGTPQPWVTYQDRPGAYGIAFDKESRAAAVYCERKGFFLLGGGIEPGESEEECIRREALEETGYAVAVGKKVCLTWMPVDEFQNAMFLRYQSWAMRMAWKAYLRKH